MMPLCPCGNGCLSTLKIIPVIAIKDADDALDLRTLKFFPAEPSGGLTMLKAMSAVYPVSFMPTGGISPGNVKDYLAQGSVFACGGTWMVPADLIDRREWDKIGTLVREAMAAL